MAFVQTQAYPRPESPYISLRCHPSTCLKRHKQIPAQQIQPMLNKTFPRLLPELSAVAK